MEKNKEKTIKAKNPSWIKIKPAELQKIVTDLAKQGLSPSQIGLALRDKHGIPKTKLLGKKISLILKESEIEHQPEKAQAERKIEKLRAHIKKNKHDYTASRSLTKHLWTIYHLNQNK